MTTAQHFYDSQSEAVLSVDDLIQQRAALLAALKAVQEHRCVGTGCYNTAHAQVAEAIRAAEGRPS